MRSLFFAFLFTVFSYGLLAQLDVSGRIADSQGPLMGALILVDQTNLAAVTNADGRFFLKSVPQGNQTLNVQFVGYKNLEISILVKQDMDEILIDLVPDPLGLDEVVVSANRYATDRKAAPVEVNLIGNKMLRATQSISLADGLNFQPGIRVENNCQNCGFTQVRMNGLQGPYTQILINSRAVFSALIGVYGLEMIPSYMIDQIEIVKSGGSALYGANAIAGTVNVITKDPVLNRWEVNSNYASIDGVAGDWSNSVNGAYVSNDLGFGISGFVNFRDRDSYDANGDGFTEMVELNSQVLGLKSYYKLSTQTKVSMELNHVDEFRKGGDKLDLLPEYRDVTEQIDHNIWMYGLNIDHYLNGGADKFSVYGSFQNTTRNSYYGGLGGGRTPQDSLLAANAYGITKDQSGIVGAQWNHFANGDHALTGGVEYQYNRTDDEVPGYSRRVDQTVNNLGVYGQWEWQATSKLKLLTGLRYDLSQVDGIYQLADIERTIDNKFDVFSPRFTFLADLTSKVQFRGGYARGFRAPQAFNEALHIASAGGEPVFVLLSESLNKETSDAWTASFSYEEPNGTGQFNLSLQGFYTQLNNPFVQVNTGAQLPNGSIIEEVRNGQGAFVSGLNVEANYAQGKNLIIQSGFTAQQARYNESQVIYEPEAPEEGETVFTQDFLRTPKLYGYLNATYETNKEWEFSLTNVVTGQMQVAEILQSDGSLIINESPVFWNTTIKAGHHFHIGKNLHIEVNGGVQNLFNSYQSDFQSGPLRDSTYVYGPGQPRTFFFGLTFKNND